MLRIATHSFLFELNVLFASVFFVTLPSNRHLTEHLPFLRILFYVGDVFADFNALWQILVFFFSILAIGQFISG
jgi:hypothetical protein